jgi:hypothetical protein
MVLWVCNWAVDVLERNPSSVLYLFSHFLRAREALRIRYVAFPLRGFLPLLCAFIRPLLASLAIRSPAATSSVRGPSSVLNIDLSLLVDLCLCLSTFPPDLDLDTDPQLLVGLLGSEEHHDALPST